RSSGGEGSVERIDAVGDVEGRALVALREEVAHRPVERARHPHRDAIDGDNREGAVDPAYGVGLARQDAAPRLLSRHAMQVCERRIDEIDDAADILVVHARIMDRFATGPPGRAWEAE